MSKEQDVVARLLGCARSILFPSGGKQLPQRLVLRATLHKVGYVCLAFFTLLLCVKVPPTEPLCVCVTDERQQLWKVYIQIRDPTYYLPREGTPCLLSPSSSHCIEMPKIKALEKLPLKEYAKMKQRGRQQVRTNFTISPSSCSVYLEWLLNVFCLF